MRKKPPHFLKVTQTQYSTALSSPSALQEYWNKYGEVIDGYEKEDPEDYIG